MRVQRTVKKWVAFQDFVCGPESHRLSVGPQMIIYLRFRLEHPAQSDRIEWLARWTQLQAHKQRTDQLNRPDRPDRPDRATNTPNP